MDIPLVSLIILLLFHSLISVVFFFGSLKWFKYLLLNKCKITEETLKYSIVGGNQEVINILKETNNKFEECLETSVKYHIYELINWLLEQFTNVNLFLFYIASFIITLMHSLLFRTWTLNYWNWLIWRYMFTKSIMHWLSSNCSMFHWNWC